MQRRHFVLHFALGSAWAAIAAPARAEPEDQVWIDDARGRSLPVLLRWPEGDAPCPLVVHSHGLGGSRTGGDVWGRSWQQAGMAVLHLQHPGSDAEVLRNGLRALRAAASGEQLRARVADLHFAVDEITRRARRGEPGWSRVRLDALGASGHSFGAVTVMALAGQRFAVSHQGVAEPRFKAFVAFSPSPPQGHVRDAFADVRRPMLLVTGSLDADPLGRGITGADRASVYDDLPGGQRGLLWLDGADHMTEGIDFAHKVEMGIRKDRYKAMVPQVVAPLRLSGRVHQAEARLLRAHTQRVTKFTLPGPMTIVDTVADRYYGDRVKLAFAFAEMLNEEARALEADGIDIVQFDEPAFNVFMAEAADWGVAALERARQGLTCKTAVHICYGYGIDANRQWKDTLGQEWRQYEQVFPALAASRIDQVSLECMHSHVPLELIGLLEGKEVMVGVIDVASDVVETADEVADTIGRALQFVDRDKLIACTNCGMAPMKRAVAEAKLAALAGGTALAAQRH